MKKSCSGFDDPISLGCIVGLPDIWITSTPHVRLARFSGLIQIFTQTGAAATSGGH
jgi:hypothetical protein